MKLNNSITVSVYNGYKINNTLLNAGPMLDFSVSFHLSLTPFIAVAAINKLQENYFSTVVQCFPYPTTTAVTHTEMLLFRMPTAANVIAYILQLLSNIILDTNSIHFSFYHQ